MRVLLVAFAFLALVQVCEPMPDRTMGEQWAEAESGLNEIVEEWENYP